MKQPIYDGRLYRYPKLFSDGETMVLSGKFHTPRRFTYLENLIFEPLVFLWKLALFVLVCDLALVSLKLWTVFWYLPIEKQEVYIAMLLSFVLYKAEKMSFYKVSRFLFGRRLSVRMDENGVTIGGWFKKRHFTWDQNITFSSTPFNMPYSPIYKVSHRFDVIVDQSRRVLIAEIYGMADATCLANNISVAAHLIGQNGMEKLDVDPTRINTNQYAR